MVLELLLVTQVRVPTLTRTRAHPLGSARGAVQSRLPARAAVAADTSHPAMAVNLDACIQCTRCLRACRDEQVNDVIGLAGRGAQAKIVFDADALMGESSCVACGECVQACPTGALMPAAGIRQRAIQREVNSVCPTAAWAVSSPITWALMKAARAESNSSPVAMARPIMGACASKGRYGFDHVQHGERLTVPLIRREGVGKDAADIERVKRANCRLHRYSVRRRPGTKHSISRRLACAPYETAPSDARRPRRWPASARRRAATKRPISSRNWCARAFAATTSIIARGFATPARSLRCWKALAPAR